MAKKILLEKITEIRLLKNCTNTEEKIAILNFEFSDNSGSGPNGAVIHYKATKTNRKLIKGDIYLVDSGGQYKFGTTDVTRTISLKNSNKRVKIFYKSIKRSYCSRRF